MAATPTPRPIPDDYSRVIPSLVVRGAAEALDFYTQVLGAEERMRMPGPGEIIMHSEIAIGDSILFVADESPEMGFHAPPSGGITGASVAHMVYVEDVDSVLARAEKAGAVVRRAPEDQFYGDRTATILDPFGHIWTLATHVEDVAPEEMGRRAEEWAAQQGS
jgi:PhnB protein